MSPTNHSSPNSSLTDEETGAPNEEVSRLRSQMGLVTDPGLESRCPNQGSSPNNINHNKKKKNRKHLNKYWEVLKYILYVCIFIPVLPLGASEPFFFF